MLYIGSIVIVMLLILGVASVSGFNTSGVVGVASGAGNNTSGVVGVAYVGWTEYYGMPTTTPTTRITAYPLLPSMPVRLHLHGCEECLQSGESSLPGRDLPALFVVLTELGEEMHCYSDTLPSTTTATQTVTTLATTPITQIPPIPPASDTTPATAPAASGQQVSATVALSSCRGECRCILPDTATVLGLPLCGGDPSLCSYDASGKAMYCYALAQQAATTESGIGSNTPARSSCQGDCSCLDPVTAGQAGFTLCNGTPTLCNYDANRNPMYCYSRAAGSQVVPGGDSKSGKSIPVGVFTIIGAVSTIMIIAGLYSQKKNS